MSTKLSKQYSKLSRKRLYARYVKDRVFDYYKNFENYLILYEKYLMLTGKYRLMVLKNKNKINEYRS
jgi:hypothetical protein